MSRSFVKSPSPSRHPDAPAIRLVAIDLDGTLLDDTKRVSDQTVEAMSSLPAQGVQVVIASARPPRSVRHIYRQLGLESWQINYNGAMIWDELSGLSVFHQPMSGALVRQIIDESRDRFEEVIVSCEVTDRWFTDRIKDAYQTETARLFGPDVVTDIGSICKQDITKLMLLGEPPIILRLEAMIEQMFGDQVTLVRMEDQLLQIMDRRVSKATALKRVAAHYDVPMENVMAIGDAPNDVGMLQLAGVSVAMDNAHAIVKDVADWVAPSNNDHGVHAALQRYGLCR